MSINGGQDRLLVLLEVKKNVSTSQDALTMKFLYLRYPTHK